MVAYQAHAHAEDFWMCVTLQDSPDNFPTCETQEVRKGRREGSARRVIGPGGPTNERVCVSGAMVVIVMAGAARGEEGGGDRRR